MTTRVAYGIHCVLLIDNILFILYATNLNFIKYLKIKNLKF